jgi:hypothetical protein
LPRGFSDELAPAMISSITTTQLRPHIRGAAFLFQF